MYSRGPKTVSISYFKRPKKHAVLSDKRTVWALCVVLVPYFNVLITSSSHVSVIFTIIFLCVKTAPTSTALTLRGYLFVAVYPYVYIIFREQDIKIKMQLDDSMITITILFFDNNKN